MATDGLSNIIANLDKALKEIEGKTMKGLIRASIVIRRDMDNSSPSIPVDLGNLRASYFTVTSTGRNPAGKSPNFRGSDSGELTGDHSSVVANAKAELAPFDVSLMMGFSAFYAVFVHENVGATFRQPKEGVMKAATGAKFLQAAVAKNQSKIIRIIQKEARI